MNLTEDIYRQAILSHPLHDVMDKKKAKQLALDMAMFVIESVNKYIIGQREHGGDLENINCLREMRNEIIDLVHYYNATTRQTKKI